MVLTLRLILNLLLYLPKKGVNRSFDNLIYSFNLYVQHNLILSYTQVFFKTKSEFNAEIESNDVI